MVCSVVGAEVGLEFSHRLRGGSGGGKCRSSCWSWALSKVNEALNVCAPATYSFSCFTVLGFKCSIGRTFPQIHFTSLSRSHFNCRAHTPAKFTVISGNSAHILVVWRHCSVYLQQSQLWRLGCGKFMQSYALDGERSCCKEPPAKVTFTRRRRYRAHPNMLHAPTDCIACIASLHVPNQIFHFKCYLFYCRLPDSKSSPRPLPLPFPAGQILWFVWFRAASTDLNDRNVRKISIRSNVIF